MHVCRGSSPALLVEVDRWTGLSKHLVHGANEAPPKDACSFTSTAVLAQATNLGFTRMAQVTE